MKSSNVEILPPIEAGKAKHYSDFCILNSALLQRLLHLVAGEMPERAEGVILAGKAGLSKIKNPRSKINIVKSWHSHSSPELMNQSPPQASCRVGEAFHCKLPSQFRSYKVVMKKKVMPACPALLSAALLLLSLIHI